MGYITSLNEKYENVKRRVVCTLQCTRFDTDLEFTGKQCRNEEEAVESASKKALSHLGKLHLVNLKYIQAFTMPPYEWLWKPTYSGGTLYIYTYVSYKWLL